MQILPAGIYTRATIPISMFRTVRLGSRKRAQSKENQKGGSQEKAGIKNQW